MLDVEVVPVPVEIKVNFRPRIARATMHKRLDQSNGQGRGDGRFTLHDNPVLPGFQVAHGLGRLARAIPHRRRNVIHIRRHAFHRTAEPDKDPSLPWIHERHRSRLERNGQEFRDEVVEALPRCAFRYRHARLHGIDVLSQHPAIRPPPQAYAQFAVAFSDRAQSHRRAAIRPQRGNCGLRERLRRHVIAPVRLDIARPIEGDLPLMRVQLMEKRIHRNDPALERQDTNLSGGFCARLVGQRFEDRRRDVGEGADRESARTEVERTEILHGNLRRRHRPLPVQLDPPSVRIRRKFGADIRGPSVGIDKQLGALARRKAFRAHPYGQPVALALDQLQRGMAEHQLASVAGQMEDVAALRPLLRKDLGDFRSCRVRKSPFKNAAQSIALKCAAQQVPADGVRRHRRKRHRDRRRNTCHLDSEIHLSFSVVVIACHTS